jgi:HAE1 family hydrophobic/amphiphilic exporter-1
VKIDISKASGESILSVAGDIKASVEERFLSQSDPGLQFQYAEDTADNIYDSFADVGSNGLITIVLVFIAVFIFVGLKQSIIATISIPLAFFVTFIVLNQLDLSLNFLTNFSLIVTFGIAIDTIIVIIEAATEKSKL